MTVLVCLVYSLKGRQLFGFRHSRSRQLLSAKLNAVWNLIAGFTGELILLLISRVSLASKLAF